MKVGILTFHFCYNFGAVLQSVGLAKQIGEFGHDVEVIDFRPVDVPIHPAWKGWGLRKKHPLQNIKLRWIDLYYGNLMRKSFDSFLKKHVSLSDPCNPGNIGGAVQRYDALVVGSDQVWNRSHYCGQKAYFLDFIGGYNGKKVSYAACSGHGEFFGSPEDRSFLEKALQDFDSISVRNKLTQEWTHSFCGFEPRIVADPTLLINFRPYEEKASVPFEKYILAYILGKGIPGGNQRAIREIRKHHGDLPVISICSSAHKPESYCTWADHQVLSAGPGEWLSLIKDCAFFLTDSFHGVMFALKNKKRFIGYYSEAHRAGRLLDTAERYGIHSAIVGGLDEAADKNSFGTILDYNKIDERIRHHRLDSMTFLREALG